MPPGYKTSSGDKPFLMEPLGNYVLLQHISAGGMAELFLAVRLGPEGFERLAAIKRIHKHLSLQRDFIDMFVQEAKVAALLSHPNIVHIYDLGGEEETYYIAMEYVSGKDLGDVTRRWRELDKIWPPEQAAFAVSKVCAGLDYAHKKKDLKGNDLNLVHRDISPQNILISYDGEVKLVDFGIAKAATQSTVTQTGVLKGKVAYMSPEQAWGSTVDRRSDIFSIGIVSYEMLTGQRLFKGNSDLNTLEQVRQAAVEPPTKVAANIPLALEAIVLKALAKEPSQRYQTAGQMQADLEKFLYDHRFQPSSYNLSMAMHTLFQGDIVEEGLKIHRAEQQIQKWREVQATQAAATKIGPATPEPPRPSAVMAPPPPPAAPPRSRPTAPRPVEKPPGRTGLKASFLILGLLIFIGVAAAGGYLAFQWLQGQQKAGKEGGSPPSAAAPERGVRAEREPSYSAPAPSPPTSPSAPPKEEVAPSAPEETPSLAAPQYAFSFGGSAQERLEEPVSMAVDATGSLFVLDHNRYRVLKFNLQGELLTSWGKKGSREGEFNDPMGITVDPYGDIYVADTGNNRVQKFNSFGVFSYLVGGKGKNGLQEPIAVAADRSGHLFVLDKKKAKVFKYSVKGDLLSEWGGQGEGALKKPVKMVADSQNNLFILDAGSGRINKFNNQGEFLASAGSKKEGRSGRKKPLDIAVDRVGRIYMLDGEGGKIYRFSSKGKLETFFGGKEEGIIKNPIAVTVSPRGVIYVADKGAKKIHQYK
jgi:serine/threonine protein kinase/sugar lactone lactonase YvrE